METVVFEAQIDINKLVDGFQHYYRPGTPLINCSIGGNDCSLRTSGQKGLSYHAKATIT